MQEIRDPACLETLYRKLELSSRTRTAKRPRRSFPVRALHFLFVFLPHQQQQPGGCHSLQDEPAGHDLLIAPAQTLAHMVVQRGQGVLEDGDVQKPA